MDMATRESPRLLYVGGGQDEIFTGLARSARVLGFDHCGYLIGVPESCGDWRFAAINDFPRRWQERYRKFAYHDIDPMVEYAKQGELALTWSPELFQRETLNSLRKAARTYGFSHGWVQPLRAAHGCFGMLMLARRQAALTSAELREKQALMQWMAQVAHTVLFRVLYARQCEALSAKLTEREIELLQQAADGKTAADMARILDVRERTANFHIANAIQKLGATNKTQAVALAMRLGLLK